MLFLRMNSGFCMLAENYNLLPNTSSETCHHLVVVEHRAPVVRSKADFAQTSIGIYIDLS